MPDVIHDIPTAEIDEAALVRDRLSLDPVALEELIGSIGAEGLRLPIEVFALEAARDGRSYGLISGFRRLKAVRALAAAGVEGWGTIAAIVRAPADMGAALALMVEENEVREEVAPWDRGEMLRVVVARELFADVDAAIEGLYPRASAATRTRLRASARVAAELDGVFAAPERFAYREVMRLAAACRAGFGAAIAAAAAEVERGDFARQREAVAPVLAEAAGAGPEVGLEPGAAVVRVAELRPGLTVRRAKVKGGWSFRFTGREASWMLLEPAFIDLEATFRIG